MYCIKCGKQVEGNEKYCEDCRNEMLLFEKEKAENTGSGQTADQPVVNSIPYTAPASMPDNGPWKVFAIVGFALGIFSLCMSWFIYFSLIWGAFGLIFSILGRKSTRNGGKAKAGIVMNAIAMGISLIATIVFFAVIIGISSGMGGYYR